MFIVLEDEKIIIAASKNDQGKITSQQLDTIGELIIENIRHGKNAHNLYWRDLAYSGNDLIGRPSLNNSLNVLVGLSKKLSGKMIQHWGSPLVLTL